MAEELTLATFLRRYGTNDNCLGAIKDRYPKGIYPLYANEYGLRCNYRQKQRMIFGKLLEESVNI